MRQTMGQAQERRLKSKTAQLKKFHNEVIRVLLKRCSLIFSCYAASTRYILVLTHLCSNNVLQPPQIKKKMVFVLARQVPALLDLACGRGGDIWKWIDADVQSVLGVDISEHEVAECRRRSVTYISPAHCFSGVNNTAHRFITSVINQLRDAILVDNHNHNHQTNIHASPFISKKKVAIDEASLSSLLLSRRRLVLVYSHYAR